MNYWQKRKLRKGYKKALERAGESKKIHPIKQCPCCEGPKGPQGVQGVRFQSCKELLKDVWQIFLVPYQILFKAIKIADDYEITLFKLKLIIKATDKIAKDLYSGDYIDSVEWANWKTGECQLLATNSNGSLLINPYTGEPKRFIIFLNFVLVYKGDDTEDYQQKCRFYLDDYKEQEEIRKEWFGINHPKALYIYSSQFVSYLDKLILTGVEFKLIFNKNPYQHFENRFMRKN